MTQEMYHFTIARGTLSISRRTIFRVIIGLFLVMIPIALIVGDYQSRHSMVYNVAIYCGNGAPVENVQVYHWEYNRASLYIHGPALDQGYSPNCSVQVR